MLISICAELFDLGGDFLLDADPADSDFSGIARRVSRTATLDGGCILVDNGYTASDAVFVIVLKSLDVATRARLNALVMTHSAILVSPGDGVYAGVVEKMDDGGFLKIRFLVNQQISE